MFNKYNTKQINSLNLIYKPTYFIYYSKMLTKLTNKIFPSTRHFIYIFYSSHVPTLKSMKAMFFFVRL